MRAVNPATGELIREYAEHSETEVEERVRRAAQAFRFWRQTSFAERARLMKRAPAASYATTARNTPD